jgi:hypothetical protein
MDTGWVNALDACASAGIIEYDAPADILGQKPRYVGSPKMNEIPTKILTEDIKIKTSPDKDEFQSHGDNLVQNPKWKKVLFGILVVGSVVGTTLFALFKMGKIKLPKFLKKIMKKP